jgi:hypothetical protein
VALLEKSVASKGEPRFVAKVLRQVSATRRSSRWFDDAPLLSPSLFGWVRADLI